MTCSCPRSATTGIATPRRAGAGGRPGTSAAAIRSPAPRHREPREQLLRSAGVSSAPFLLVLVEMAAHRTALRAALAVAAAMLVGVRCFSVSISTSFSSEMITFESRGSDTPLRRRRRHSKGGHPSIQLTQLTLRQTLREETFIFAVAELKRNVTPRESIQRA